MAAPHPSTHTFALDYMPMAASFKSPKHIRIPPHPPLSLHVQQYCHSLPPLSLPAGAAFPHVPCPGDVSEPLLPSPASLNGGWAQLGTAKAAAAICMPRRFSFPVPAPGGLDKVWGNPLLLPIAAAATMLFSAEPSPCAAQLEEAEAPLKLPQPWGSSSCR